MEPENQDAPEVLETPAEEVIEVEPETPAEPEVDEKDAKIAELTEKNKQLFERAKKAEALKKEPAAPGSMSTADIIALTKVHEDDVERVERFAKSEGVSIKEALKNPELKAILGVRAEHRDTAATTNVTNTRRGPTKIADDVLLANANKGQLPDSDEDIERLIAAKTRRK